MKIELPDTIPFAAIEAARARIADAAIRTPLLRLVPAAETSSRRAAEPEIWLKLEALQPVGSFKIRGARNALAALEPAIRRKGVYTASAGNMALGLAWCAKQEGIPCTVVVPDTAPRAKLDKLEQLEARIIPVPFARWWQVMEEHEFEGAHGSFIHPVANLAVMAGNGTIACEILEELPSVDTVLVPFGGGGLSCGIASGLRGLDHKARVIGCEVETATPLTAALTAGAPRQVERIPSFVDGIGGSGVLPEMWPLVQRLIAGSAIVTLLEIRRAIRELLEKVHVLAEGAGASSVAAARSGRVEGGVICCVVSGGNIDAAVVAEILQSSK
jgi:threonine dehydratase